MGELIFFAVIILFSILESIARGKKKRDAEPGPSQDGWEPEHIEWEADETALEERPEAETGSEAMIPSEIWEEIAGLASGRGAGAPTRPARTPRALPVPEEVESRARIVSRERGPARPEHRVHQAHASYGTDPSSRKPSEQDGLDPLAEFLGEDARRARAMLTGGGGTHARRQAVILHAVLGPPPGLSEE